MFSVISAVNSNVKEFNKALVAGQQRFADLQSGQDAPIRGVSGIDDATGTSGDADANQARQTGQNARETSPNEAAAVVDITTAANSANASIALLRSQDDMLGSLLNVVA